MPTIAETARLVAKQIKVIDIKAYSPKNWDYRKLAYPFSYMFHPFNAGYDIKYEKKGSLGLANIIALLFFLTTMFSKAATGFIFNRAMPESLNMWLVFGQTVGLLVLWTISNWSLCTLMDGEGRLKEIWISTCYSMLPSVIFTALLVPLSNILVLEEAAFLTIAELIVNGWCFVLVFLSVMIVQQYTFKKTVLSMIFTAAGVAAIIFLLILAMSLFQQLSTFLRTVFKEISFRL